MQTQTETTARRNGTERAERTLLPAVDIFENDEEILIVADLPGVPKDALEIHLDGGELTLEGRRTGERPATLRRTFRVPATIDPSRVVAEMDAGVLRVHLPKRADAKPRRIEVNGG